MIDFIVIFNQEAESVQQLATYNAIVSSAVTPIVGELRKLSCHTCHTCHTAQQQVKEQKQTERVTRVRLYFTSDLRACSCNSNVHTRVHECITNVRQICLHACMYSRVSNPSVRF